MHHIIRSIEVSVLAAALVGCASTSYVYRPASAAAPETGYMMARYGVPAEAPRGEVFVTSFGVTRLAVAPNVEAPMLHVRVGVANNAAPTPWTIDAREQRLTIAGGGSVGPTYANSDGGGPIVTIPVGQQRVVDLYYALPVGERDARDVPSFEVSWTVRTGDRVVAERTPFLRDVAPAEGSPPPPAFVAVGLGWGAAWWYDPLWPYPAAVAAYRPIIVHYTAPAYVARPAPGLGPPGWRGRPVARWRGHPVH